jgi:D-hexose-6-phosphate mutarotase
MPTSLREIQDRFTLANVVRFDIGKGGLTRAVITTPAASAEIYLHGAHLTHYQPSGGEPVLWASQSSLYQPDKPIRGGVPICFPWFGPRAGNPGSPIHGFARIMEWQVESVQQIKDGTVVLAFSLTTSEQTRGLWPAEFAALYEVRIGQQLELALKVKNNGSAAFSFEEALHTYFTVGDARRATVTGLEGTTYIDKTDGMKLKTQAGPVMIEAETDRVYLNTQAACTLHDPTLGRKITIDKSGSDATVVWNPWIAKAKAMADFGDDEWTQMLCVETVNAGDHRVTVAPGQTQEMRAVIGLAN